MLFNVKILYSYLLVKHHALYAFNIRNQFVSIRDYLFELMSL